MGQGRNKGDLNLFSSTESAGWWGWQCEEKKTEIKQPAEEKRIQDYYIGKYMRGLERGYTLCVNVVSETKRDNSQNWGTGWGMSGQAQNSDIIVHTSCLTSTLCDTVTTCQLLPALTHMCTQAHCTCSHKHVVLNKVPMNRKNKPHLHQCGIDWDPHQHQSSTKTCLGHAMCLGLLMQSALCSLHS